MSRLGIAVILLFAAVQAQAGKLNVTYLGGKPWSVVVNGVATTNEANVREIEVDVPDGKPDTIVEVHLIQDNLIAKRPLKDCGLIWKVEEREFNTLAAVHFELTNAEGAPLSSGTVELSVGKFKQSVDLTAADKGAIKFKNVPLGPATIKVTRLPVLDAASPKEMSVAVNLVGGPDGAKPIPIKVGFAVDTVDAPKSPDAGSKDAKSSTEMSKESQSESQPSGGGNSALPILLGLTAIASAVFFGWKFLLQNKEKLVAAAAKHGFQIPGEDGPATDSAPVPVQPAKSAAVEAIILPDADPMPMGASAQVHQPATAMTQEPSLITSSGQVLSIPEGLHVVSREPGSPLSLVGESSVSRNHAEIKREGAVVTVRDLGSTNGTYVNGNKIDSEVVLKSGDTLQFGQVAMRFQG